VTENIFFSKMLQSLERSIVDASRKKGFIPVVLKLEKESTYPDIDVVWFTWKVDQESANVL
jgi:hypothetical protein